MDAIVLAGGHARRMGGGDKAAALVAGVSMLDRVLGALAEAHEVVVVGPRRRVVRPVVWTLEEPAGGGPVAALAAGLPFVSAESVAVLAADLPQMTASTIAALGAAAAGHDGATCVDAKGRAQPLAAVYSTSALRAALDRLGDVEGRSMQSLSASMDLASIDCGLAAVDCDTPEQIAAAEQEMGGDG